MYQSTWPARSSDDISVYVCEPMILPCSSSYAATRSVAQMPADKHIWPSTQRDAQIHLMLLQMLVHARAHILLLHIIDFHSTTFKKKVHLMWWEMLKTKFNLLKRT